MAEPGPNPNFGQLSEMKRKQTEKVVQYCPETTLEDKLKITEIEQKCNRTESSNEGNRMLYFPVDFGRIDNRRTS